MLAHKHKLTRRHISRFQMRRSFKYGLEHRRIVFGVFKNKKSRIAFMNTFDLDKKLI